MIVGEHTNIIGTLQSYYVDRYTNTIIFKLYHQIHTQKNLSHIENIGTKNTDIRHNHAQISLSFYSKPSLVIKVRLMIAHFSSFFPSVNMVTQSERASKKKKTHKTQQYTSRKKQNFVHYQTLFSNTNFYTDDDGMTTYREHTIIIRKYIKTNTRRRTSSLSPSQCEYILKIR